MPALDRREKVIEHARSFIGYRSLAQKVNDFGAKTGTNGGTWDGSYLETVFRESGVETEPAFTATATALAEYARTARLFRSPKLGDVAFFAFSTDGTFSQPHVGLVTDVSQFKLNGFFQTVEGQVAAGNPAGSSENNGVYDRVRYITDVIAFGRPDYRERHGKTVQLNKLIIRPADVQPGRNGKKVTALQHALHRANGARGMTAGKFDRATQSAVAAYQRKIGYVGDHANGLTDDYTLAKLAGETNHSFYSGSKHDA